MPLNVKYGLSAQLEPSGCIGRHVSCTAPCLAGLPVSALESEAEPPSLAVERMVIDDESNTGSLRLHFGDLGDIGVACDRSFVARIVADAITADAAWQ